MRDNTMDKVYLALELTKLYLPERNSNTVFGKAVVMETFNYFLNELNGVDDISDYGRLKEELDETKKAYNNLREELKNKATMMSQSKLEQIKEILEQSKGDMEPYVYQSLIKLVK